MVNKRARLLKRQQTNADQLIDEVEQTRNSSKNLAEEAKVVWSAPIPLEEALAAIHAAVDEAQADTSLIGGVARFMMSNGSVSLDNEATQSAHERRPLAFIAAVAPDAVRLELKRKLVAEYKTMGGTPYSRKERGGRLAQIDRDIAMLERDEELAVRMAERGGMIIERRADATPSAVLLPDRELGIGGAGGAMTGHHGPA